MGTSALGGFASGLMQGVEFADDRRRKKAVDNLLDRESYNADLETSARKEEWMKTEGNLDEFPVFENPAEEDPYLVKGFNWLKGKFGFGSGQDDQTYGVVTEAEEEPREAISDTGGSGQFQAYADGGRVKDERMKRSYGDYYVSEDEAAENRAYRESLPPRFQSPTSPYMRDQRGRLEAGRTAIPTFTGTGPGLDRADISEVVGSVKDSAAGLFDDTIRTANTAREATDETGRAVKEAEGARDTGYALGQHAKETAKAGLATGVAVGKDVLVDNPISQFVLGFVGNKGTKKNRQPDPFTPPAAAAEVGEAKRAAVDESVGAGKPDGKVAADAVDNAVAMTPGHPDNPNQAFDWAEVRQAGATSADIPNMGVKDWVEYRRRTARAAALRGQSVEDAMNDVTKMQMNGAMANMQQAAYLLQANDPESAELALRASFQYFPNGSDVKFGIYDSEQGPVLVGMGFDEETGEPVGTPMALSPEKLMAMAQNFSDPGAFNNWTKDQHQAMQDLRDREEITKPLAQGKLDLMGAQADAARAGATRDLAAARAEGKSGGGLKQTDYDRANAAFKTELDNRGVSIDDPRAADELAAHMTTLYKQLAGQLDYTQIIDLVMGVENKEFTLAEGLKRYGIEASQ